MTKLLGENRRFFAENLRFLAMSLLIFRGGVRFISPLRHVF